jgi:hypothetical protein
MSTGTPSATVGQGNYNAMASSTYRVRHLRQSPHRVAKFQVRGSCIIVEILARWIRPGEAELGRGLP